MKEIYVTLSERRSISQKYLKKSFSTIPINPVSLASHLTTSETNQVERMLEQKANLRLSYFPITYIAKQINLTSLVTIDMS